MTQEQWMDRYKRYFNGLGWTAFELDCMAFNAWESWGDEIPEEIASSDLSCMREDGE